MKFNENRSNSLEDVKWTVNHTTLKYDLDIKIAQPGHRFCALA